MPVLISINITNERLAYTRDADEEEVQLLLEGGYGARKENISQKVDVLLPSATYLFRVSDTRDAAHQSTRPQEGGGGQGERTAPGGSAVRWRPPARPDGPCAPRGSTPDALNFW